MNRVLYTNQAHKDLISIWSYISEDNPQAADKLLDFIYEKCQLLADNPYIGQARADISADMRYFPVRNYLMLYQIIPDGVEIVRVLHGSMDLYAIFH